MQKEWGQKLWIGKLLYSDGANTENATLFRFMVRVLVNWFQCLPVYNMIFPFHMVFYSTLVYFFFWLPSCTLCVCYVFVLFSLCHMFFKSVGDLSACFSNVAIVAILTWYLIDHLTFLREVQLTRRVINSSDGSERWSGYVDGHRPWTETWGHNFWTTCVQAYCPPQHLVDNSFEIAAIGSRNVNKW